MKNPALHQEPRYEPAKVIRLKQDTSLLEWLQSSGRLIPREEKEVVARSGDEDVELEGLIDEDGYDFDDDDTSFNSADTLED
ncbi:MAG: DUF3134 family protein [Chloroflexaceae bacterium]|nr:DUF3134 family protein [Chloroflexaceae bacterium]